MLAEICGENMPCPAFREDKVQDFAALLLQQRANDRDESLGIGVGARLCSDQSSWAIFAVSQ